MTAPQLTRPLVLEVPVRLPDGAGGWTETWAARGVLWADVQVRSGREATGLGLTLSRVAYRITVRAAPPSAPSRPVAGMRFRDGERLFRLQAVTEAGPRARFLTCYAEEELAS